MGTGSGHDLMPQDMVDSSCVTATPVRIPLSLSTANGLIAVQSAAQVRVSALNSIADALVLPSTPAVLSIGRRCMEHGYLFVWEANSEPYTRASDGTVTTLVVNA